MITLKDENLSNGLFQISEHHYVKFNDINGIELIYEHPESKDKTGFPKYQVNFTKNSKWSWVIITVESFNKYILPFVVNKV